MTTPHPDREAALAWVENWRYTQDSPEDLLLGCQWAAVARYLLHLESEVERLKAEQEPGIVLKAQRDAALTRAESAHAAMVQARQSVQNHAMMHANAIGECRKINKAIHRVLRGRNNALKQLAASQAENQRILERLAEVSEALQPLSPNEIRDPALKNLAAILAKGDGE